MATPHLWVEFRYVPVIVTKQDNDDLKIEVKDSSEEISKEEAIYGCWHCNEELSIESFETECNNEPNQI